MTPTQLVAQLLGVDASGLQATHIKDGLTNDSYRVSGMIQSVVVRISNMDSVSLRINRSSEAIVLKLVEHAGIGAAVLLNQPDTHVLITREVAGRTLVTDEVGADANIKRIAALLQKLHSMAVPDTVQSMWLADTLKGYWQLLNQPENEKALNIAHESDQQVLRCLCHNDVHHLNLIDDGSRLWLLDWEYAAIGDPLFDLAAVCCYHQFEQRQRLMLLEAYTSALLQVERQRPLPPRGGETERGELISRSDAMFSTLSPALSHQGRGSYEGSADMARLDRMCWLFDYIKELWFAARKASGEAQNQNSTILTNNDKSK